MIAVKPLKTHVFRPSSRELDTRQQEFLAFLGAILTRISLYPNDRALTTVIRKPLHGDVNQDSQNFQKEKSPMKLRIGCVVVGFLLLSFSPASLRHRALIVAHFAGASWPRIRGSRCGFVFPRVDLGMTRVKSRNDCADFSTAFAG
jgi:hypothetical protein